MPDDGLQDQNMLTFIDDIIKSLLCLTLILM